MLQNSRPEPIKMCAIKRDPRTIKLLRPQSVVLLFNTKRARLVPNFQTGTRSNALECPINVIFFTIIEPQQVSRSSPSHHHHPPVIIRYCWLVSWRRRWRWLLWWSFLCRTDVHCTTSTRLISCCCSFLRNWRMLISLLKNYPRKPFYCRAVQLARHRIGQGGGEGDLMSWTRWAPLNVQAHNSLGALAVHSLVIIFHPLVWTSFSFLFFTSFAFGS